MLHLKGKTFISFNRKGLDGPLTLRAIYSVGRWHHVEVHTDRVVQRVREVTVHEVDPGYNVQQVIVFSVEFFGFSRVG